MRLFALVGEYGTRVVKRCPHRIDFSDEVFVALVWSKIRTDMSNFGVRRWIQQVLQKSLSIGHQARNNNPPFARNGVEGK